MEKKCKECGYTIDESMHSCPNCGADLDASGEMWYKTNILNIAINPIVNGFDSGNFFRKIIIDIFYSLGLIFLLAPTIYSFYICRTKLFVGETASYKAVLICAVIIVLLFGIFSCGYWVKRIYRLNRMFNPIDEFVVMPIGSYSIQWIGEWFAILLGLAGIMSIILSFVNVDSIPFFSSFFIMGWAYGIIAIVLAIIIVFISRFYAESKRALTSIANNTGRLSNNEKINLLDENEEERNGLLWNIIYAVSLLVTIVCLIISIFQK